MTGRHGEALKQPLGLTHEQRACLEVAFWSRRPEKSFGWKTLGQYTDAFLEALEAVVSADRQP